MPQLDGFQSSKWVISFIWHIDRTLKDTTNPDQSGPESNGNEGILHIPQSSKAEASPSNGLVSYLGHLLKGYYPSAEIQWVYSTVPAN